MNNIMYLEADKYGIINTLPEDLSQANKQRLKHFGRLMILYDAIQKYYVRPKIHKANQHDHHKMLGSLISPLKRCSVLELACGTGNAIKHFDDSIEYTGLDLSYSMLKQALKKLKKKSFRKFSLIQGNAEELLFDNDTFDCVLMDTALHMIPDYQSSISEISRVLKQKGIFICSTPVTGINSDFDSGWKKITENNSIHSLTEDDIKKACSRSGLDFKRCGTNGGVLYFQAYKN